MTSTALPGTPSDAAVSPETPTESAARVSLLEHGWWGVGVFLAGMLSGSIALSDNSFLTHLATGRLIRAGHLPHVDPYSFTRGGQAWISQSWLASWWYATLEAIGGAGAIRLFVAVMTGVLSALLWRLSRPAGGLVGRLLLVLVAMAVGVHWWTERPQLIAYVLLAGICVVLAERLPAWWCAPAMAVWVNVHGSWPVGLVLIALWVGRDVVVRRRFVPSDLGLLLWGTIGTVVAAVVGPYGWGLLMFPLEMSQRGAVLSFIQEWRSPDLGEINTWLFAGEALLVLGLLVWRRRDVTTSLVALIFVALAAYSARNLAIASIVLVPLGASAFTGLGALSVGPKRARRSLSLACGLAVCASVLIVAATPNYDLSPYPVRAVDWLAARGWVGTPNVRVVTHDLVGNYLEWRYGARANVWFDDRAELYSYDEVRDYVWLLSGDPQFAQTLDRYAPDVVLWSTKTKLATQLASSAEYRVIYRDADAIVACRIGSSIPC